MARSQQRSKRKISGGRYRSSRGKRKFELGGFPAMTKLAVRQAKKIRVIGGNVKQKLLATNMVQVSDATGKTQKAEILNVVENTANPNLVRRNVMTQGCVVDTKLGKVRITSRPGQEGTLQGMILK